MGPPSSPFWCAFSVMKKLQISAWLVCEQFTCWCCFHCKDFEVSMCVNRLKRSLVVFGCTAVLRIKTLKIDLRKLCSTHWKKSNVKIWFGKNQKLLAWMCAHMWSYCQLIFLLRLLWVLVQMTAALGSWGLYQHHDAFCYPFSLCECFWNQEIIVPCPPQKIWWKSGDNLLFQL